MLLVVLLLLSSILHLVVSPIVSLRVTDLSKSLITSIVSLSLSDEEVDSMLINGGSPTSRRSRRGTRRRVGAAEVRDTESGDSNKWLLITHPLLAPADVDF